MYRALTGMGLVAAVGVVVGFGLGSASGQPAPPGPAGVDLQMIRTVDAGDNCPGHVLRMRRVTFAPGASIPMHSHKDHPEVSLVMEGTLTNTVKGQPPEELSAGAPVLNGPEVEHLPANKTDKPLVIISVDLIKK
jgi:quercetin dioxygenase-like cupin family protein